ncbi:MAG TPA: replicative DNA helicase [Candidatus Azoamicus sp. OHIO2]
MTTKTTSQILIFSLEAEQAVLGAVILDNNCWEIVVRTLIKSDFYRKSHQILFEYIGLVMDDCLPVDIVTLSNLLIKNNNLEKIGGFDYLNSIIKSTPSSKNIIVYLNIVKDKAILRSIISINKDIIDYALSNKYKRIEDIIDYSEEQIMSISRRYKYKGDYITASDILTKTLKRIEDLYYLNATIIGLSSGFEELDRLTLGFNKSDLIIIAGRPSMGKTAFAMNIAEHVVIDLKKTILIFSMEMTGTQVIERMLSSIGRVSLNKVRNGMLDETDWPRLTHAVTLLSQHKFFIYDAGPVDLFNIKSIARKVFSSNKDLAAIIIDYIQLIKILGGSENRVQELAEISRSLKSLARELDIPIIALSQLNRGLESRLDKKPIMSDIRESGAIEQDADLIIFIYRDEIYNKINPEVGKADIIISKQRNGPTGEFKLDFLAEFVKFESINKDYKEYWK